MNDWDIIDLHFKDHKYPFTNHHLDSYRELIKNHIPKIIKAENPITMIKFEDDKTSLNMQVDVYIGGKNSDLIYIDHPITIENGVQKIITPNDARLKSITYESHIYTDVLIEITNRDGDVYSKIIEKVAIGSIPIMLHSDICILNNNGKKVLQRLGECIYDGGGYFIIDGKEKVIIAQETETNNRLIVGRLKDDDDFSFKGKIKCSGETGESVLIPRMIEFYLVKTDDDVTEKFSNHKGAIYVSLPSIEGKIPLFILFRALGIESDKEIYETIFGADNHPIETSYFENFIRPSVYNNYYIRDFDKEKIYIYTQEEALNYIKFRTKYQTLDYVKYLFAADILPNISLFENKGKYLGYLVKDFINISFGIQRESDRDNYYNKRIYTSGFLLAELFQEAYKRLRKTIRDTMDNFYYYNAWKNKDEYSGFITKDNIYRLIPVVLIANTFAKSLKGRWGLETDEDPDLAKVQDLSRISYIGFLSHLRRVNMPIDRTIKVTAPHKLHPHQWGIMCPYETPDGEAVGYLKNLAFITKVTAGTNPEFIRQCLLDIGVIPIEFYNLKLNRNICKIFINNSWYGITNDPIRIMRILRAYRRNALINILTSVLWNNTMNEIRIYVDVGRAVRPLIILNKGQTQIFNNKYNNWFDLIIGKYNNYKEKQRNEEIYYKDEYVNPQTLEVFKGKSEEEILELLESGGAMIEYIDPQESDGCFIAMTQGDVSEFHTHLEINPSMMLSVVSANIPMSNHNAAARNVFHAAQTKQAIGIYASNFNKRFDTFRFIQHYPQKAIVNTRHSQFTGSDMMANGANLIVAIMTYTGFNQEDSLIINRQSIERGLFHLSYYKTISDSTKKINDYERVVFANPLKFKEKLREDAEKSGKNFQDFDLKLKNARYDLLDDDGCIKEGSYIPKGQKAIIIGKILIKETLREIKRGLLIEKEKVTLYIDQSVTSDDTYYGYINKVHKDSKPQEDIKVWKVRLMKIKIPEFGDKHCSRHGQKGVIGMILPEEQMPFTKDGIRPDLIVNPHAIPSRMTIGHLVECVYSKLCCLQGLLGDGTVYINFDYEKIYSQLENNKYHKHGNEILYNGQTGKQMNTEIFIGPTYYFRLKHMVAEKINARGIGPVMQLTRQPTGGRRNAGGLRIGEMERDSLISHGISRFIKESMMERSDKYRWRVCNNCGTIPVYNNKIKDAYCNLCGNTQINIIETPYTFKLLNQEFEGMGVQIRYNCEHTDIPFEEHEEEIAAATMNNYEIKKLPITINEEVKEKKKKKVIIKEEAEIKEIDESEQEEQESKDKSVDELIEEVSIKFPSLTGYKKPKKTAKELLMILKLKTLKEAKEYLTSLKTHSKTPSKTPAKTPVKIPKTKDDFKIAIANKYPSLKLFNYFTIKNLQDIYNSNSIEEAKEIMKEIKTNKKGGAEEEEMEEEDEIDEDEDEEEEEEEDEINEDEDEEEEMEEENEEEDEIDEDEEDNGEQYGGSDVSSEGEEENEEVKTSEAMISEAEVKVIDI